MADTYTVTRSTSVAASPEQIFPLIADFHRWTAWSPWEGLDPQLRRTYSGACAGVGAVYGWTGNRRAGRGRMEIVEATEPSPVRIDLRFEKPFRSHSECVFTVAPQGSGSLVTWSMTGAQTWMTSVMGLFTSMDRLIGPDFEKGLDRLRAVAEASS